MIPYISREMSDALSGQSRRQLSEPTIHLSESVQSVPSPPMAENPTFFDKLFIMSPHSMMARSIALAIYFLSR